LLDAGLSMLLWLRQSTDTTEGIASGNGRIEAVLDVNKKQLQPLIAGRKLSDSAKWQVAKCSSPKSR
jgi:hypothetical protein